MLSFGYCAGGGSDLGGGGELLIAAEEPQLQSWMDAKADEDRLLKLSTFVAPHPLDPQLLHHFPAVAEDDFRGGWRVANVTKLGPQMHFRICIQKRCCDTIPRSDSVAHF